jgi:DNA-binding NtrC family response regulator
VDRAREEMQPHQGSRRWAVVETSTIHEQEPRLIPGALEAHERYLPCVSPQMQALAAVLARVAATAAPVLICGETGAGKSTLAQQVHEDSPWRGAPLVVLQAATATAAAVNGLTALAGQTVLLEEVSELAPVVQDTLVRLLNTAATDGGFRLLTTSSQDVGALASRKVLRADLLYRIDVVRLEIPPLRQRPDDVVFLAEHFLALAARRFQRDVHGLGPDARDALLRHRWVGNVRELRNCITESVLRCDHRCLRAADLQLRPAAAADDPEAELVATLARLHAAYPTGLYGRMQRLLLQWALAACDGNRIRTAALLGIGRGSLRAKLRRHGLDQH